MENAAVRVWLAIGWGEGGAQNRIVRSDAEMIEWLWEQCGHDYTGVEQHARDTWAEYITDEDNWQRLDDLPRWWCRIDVGETGHIEFIGLLDEVADLYLLTPARRWREDLTPDPVDLPPLI